MKDKGQKRKYQPSALHTANIGKKTKQTSSSTSVLEKTKSSEKAVFLDPMIDVQSDEDEQDEEDDVDGQVGDDGIEEEDGVEEFDGMDDEQDLDNKDIDEDETGEIENEDEDEENAQHNSNGKDKAAAPSSRPSTTGLSRLYAAPTLAELDTLRTASDTGGASFSLQLSALLSSTLLPPNPPASLRSLLTAIHDLILSLPSLPGLSPKAAETRLTPKGSKSSGVGRVPFPGPKEFDPTKTEVKWTLGWERPVEVFVAGTWPVCGGYKKAKGQMGSIDLVVTMPSSMFSAKDRMNYRYFHKRVHYLAIILQAITKASQNSSSALHGVTIRWDNSNDERRPILVLNAGKDQGLKYAVDIRIHTSIPADTFTLSTLYPTKSLIRSSTADDLEETTSTFVRTPLYSTSILRDMLHKPYLLLLHRLSQLLADRTLSSFLALWRIWTSKRSISPTRGGGDELAVILLTAVVDGYAAGIATGDRSRVKRNRGLGKGLNYWTALRAVWEMLAATDFERTPIWVGVEESSVPKEQMVEAFGCVLVDPSGCVNVLAEWEKGDVELVRHHARETLKMLETSPDGFAEVFLRSYPSNRVFDEFIVMDISSSSKTFSLVERAEKTNNVLSSLAATTLRRGLTDRARLVHVTPYLDGKKLKLEIGLLLEPTKSTRVLDVGPSAEDPNVESFRELWGEKAELRRFKDGSISESVVWEISRPEDAASIPSRIVSFLLNRHLELGIDSSIVYQEVKNDELIHRINFAPILELPASARHASRTAGCEKLGFRPIMDSYDQLYRVIKDSDDDLPLAVLSILPVSEALRYSSPIIPHPIDIARASSSSLSETTTYTPAHEIVMQFESSPRWPDDLAAIQKLKLAMFERLAKVVSNKIKGCRAEVNIDESCESDNEVHDYASLIVLLPTGVSFKIRIHHEREKVLLNRALEPPPPIALLGTSMPSPPRRLVLPALELYHRRFVYSTLHHSRIAPLHHRFPSFSTATRLLKRWVAAHMLSPFIEPQAMELIVAKSYLDPGCLGVPGSASAGFLRTLDMISHWDWSSETLVIPLGLGEEDNETTGPSTKNSTSMTKLSLINEFRRRVENELKNSAEGVWKLATPDDLSGTRWTRMISRVVASRISSLAKAAIVASTSIQDVSILFHTPMQDYDLIIQLNTSILPRYAESIHADSSIWTTQSYRSTQLREIKIDYDPAESFVRDLQKIYNDALLVFHDQFGGNVIGIAWNPSKHQPRAFKPFLGYSTKPSESEAALVEINKDAIVAEIGRLGVGLIQHIERRS